MQDKIDYQTAKKLFESRCPNRTKFPYEVFHLCGKDEVFLLVDIPLKEFNMPRITSAKVLKLIDIPNHDPIWVYFTRNIKIADGTHRTLAKVWRGDATTKAYFPQTHYDVYKLRNT